MNTYPLRMGRINYLNVLPIYHPLESGIIPHNFELISGPPAILNDMMNQNQLHVSSCSCFEYAKHPDKYYLVDDLAIGSNGPVMSVLLLSQVSLEDLKNKTILISGESHTSVALLRLLMNMYYKINVHFETGQITPRLYEKNKPIAFLAIGDEALRLRNHKDYAYKLDLAEAWRNWMNLPFIFGLWVVNKKTADDNLFDIDPGKLLRQGRDWGMKHMDVILDITRHGCPLSHDELLIYYTKGLLYKLQDEQKKGLMCFYEKLAEVGIIEKIPTLQFFNS